MCMIKNCIISSAAIAVVFSLELKSLCNSYTEPNLYTKSSCFVHFPGPINYASAESACLSIQNGHLAFVQTEALFNEIKANIPLPGWGDWIGALPFSTSWHWHLLGSGSWPMTTPQWASGQPVISGINARGIINSNGLGSSDYGLSDSLRRYLCQIEAAMGAFIVQEVDVRLKHPIEQSNETDVFKCGKKCKKMWVCAGFSYNKATKDYTLADTDVLHGEKETASGYISYGFA